MNRPKISIVTICYNAEKTIADTVKSVLSQNYPQLEYIIVDGASSDATLEILYGFESGKFRLISEKDEGLYDALNKGINLCTGSIIGILHADDVYANSGVLSEMATHFENDEHLEAVSSSIEIYKPGNVDKPYRVYLSTRFRKWQFRLGMQPPHPGFFVKKSGFDKVGFYRIQYKISGDFDWLLRAILIHYLNVKYTDTITVHMRDGGLSSSGWKSKVLLNNEILKILKIHGIYSNKLLVYSKYLLKVFQLKSF